LKNPRSKRSSPGMLKRPTTKSSKRCHRRKKIRNPPEGCHLLAPIRRHGFPKMRTFRRATSSGRNRARRFFQDDQPKPRWHSRRGTLRRSTNIRRNIGIYIFRDFPRNSIPKFRIPRCFRHVPETFRNRCRERTNIPLPGRSFLRRRRFPILFG
jgi:hypothetical protein